MNVRNEMLIALVKEVLGPRQGPHEVLPEDHDPFAEYITGVLQPPTGDLRLDERIEDEVDDLIEETSSEEDQHSEGFAILPGIFTPALDPRSLAHSIGLSFTVEAAGDQKPQIEICATWARYHQQADGWRRSPDHYLTDMIDATQDRQEWKPQPGIRLFMRSRPLDGAAWRVSLFLVNETPVANPNKRPHTSEYIFQPQIRANLGENTRLVPVDVVREVMGDDQDTPEARENRNLGMLYRDHRALARGHMCAAMWKDIDPERPFPDKTRRPQATPFIWTDAGVVPEPHRSRFSPPDVRTELVPVYPIMAPEMDWLAQYDPEPELHPAELAEIWEPAAIKQALQPLVDGYRAWIEGQGKQVSDLDTVYHDMAQTNIQQCRTAADRMQEAIDLLAQDRNARLAFCFANKAIDIQARWKGVHLKWRPFQMAFILLNLPALIKPDHPDRDICDLLWFPTGGGKTEAYLGLTAFTLALRRLRARYRGGDDRDDSGAGVSVISRYTLRLLTIQQFRRALGVITACEFLRVQGLKEGDPAGWRPRGYPYREPFLWGKTRFAVGLWVGGGVTPNRLQSFGPIPPAGGGKYLYFAGALDILKGLRPEGYNGPDPGLAKTARENRVQGNGEPAQVTTCPACGSVLAVPADGLGEGAVTIHLLYHGGRDKVPTVSIPALSSDVQVLNPRVTVLDNNYRTLSLPLRISRRGKITDSTLDAWWYEKVQPLMSRSKTDVAVLDAVRPSRPGYFILSYPQQGPHPDKEADFEIYCPNPECELNRHAWAETVPVERENQGRGRRQVRQMALGMTIEREKGLPATIDEKWQNIPKPFQEQGSSQRSRSIPIPACTVDDQVYRRVPSLVIATVDKFARLAYEEAAASLFGNVTHYHSRFGYYREGCPPVINRQRKQYQPHPPGFGRGKPLHRDVLPFDPPDLILQDELHLIEGPLGSMVGLYETAIDILCQREEKGRTIRPKYIASTATVRKADAQVQSLFARRLFQFPPSAITANERFFATNRMVHPLDTGRAGRLYVGIAAPGKGAQTPIVRIWSALLQQAGDLKGMVSAQDLDPFWTLVGYFNAVRELAGALSLYRQDIQQWLQHRTAGNSRSLDEYHRMELSSRAHSTSLPALLKRLEIEMPSALDAVFATSMFGTGVDVSRLSLMVVHGQPKTTASYIQATGRVGRQTNGLVVTFFRATRPRDLDHYEFFTGYHSALYRYVEPVTVAPFSPRARDRGLGPLAVILLRQAREIGGNPVPLDWRVQQRPFGMYHARAYVMKDRRNEAEVQIISELFETRAGSQPGGRKPLADIVAQETESELDRWHNIAQKHPDRNNLVYYEYAMLQEPQRHVILGDAQHRNRFDEAFENAPNSLREVEETTGFKDQR